MRKLRIALAQINVTVGDLNGNRTKIACFLAQAKQQAADLVVFPELALTGYPPEDLLFNPAFIRGNLASLKKLVPLTRGITALVGFVDRDQKGSLYNAAAVLSNGRRAAGYHKMMLPNYGVFDEKRYFTPGGDPLVVEMVPGTKTAQLYKSFAKNVPGTVLIGVSICEDIWVKTGPPLAEAKAGAQILVNLSASPYHAGKLRERERLIQDWAGRCKSWVVYVNLVGGQDELVFDGGSLVASPSGRIVFRAPQFQEGLFLVEVPLKVSGTASRSREVSDTVLTVLDSDAEVFQALVLGTRDYVRKNGFSHVVIGLSGGIDSALTAAVAVAALGKEAVTGVSMPSRYSSNETQADAKAVALNLGIPFLEIPIERMFQTVLATLKPVFRDRPVDVTEENLQARIRGTLLMALANKFHWLALATGNKSELSTGYCTLYGDMVGGFAVIKDLPKTWVYRLGRTANRIFGKPVIPESVFRRPPTAELRPNQRDQDTLPPYDRLDSIVKAYVEENQTASEIRRRLKSPPRETDRVLRMIDLNEYKRRQAPIGIKITPRAFGKDRRMPITNRYTEKSL